MRRLAMLMLTCFALSSVPAMAKDSDSDNPNKKICRRLQPTGTRMGTSVCHTKAEWKAIEDARSNAKSWYDDRRAGNARTSDQ